MSKPYYYDPFNRNGTNGTQPPDNNAPDTAHNYGSRPDGSGAYPNGNKPADYNTGGNNPGGYNANGYNPNAYNTNGGAYTSPNSYQTQGVPNVYNNGWRAPVLDERAMAQVRNANWQRQQIQKLGSRCGAGILMYLVFSVVLTLILQAIFGGDASGAVYTYSLQIIVSVMAVGGSFYLIGRSSRKDVPTYLPSEPVGVPKTVFYVAIGVTCCYVSNYVTSIFVNLIQRFGFKLSGSNYDDPLNFGELLLELVAIAVIPAIIEEYSMRGVILQPLKKYGPNFAVFTTAFVFAILHGNLMQAPFAFLVGLVMGAVTVKTGSIIPAMLIHFFNNANSCITSFIIEKLGDTNGTIYYIGIFAVCALLSVIGVFYLMSDYKINGKFRLIQQDHKNYQNPYALTSAKKFAAFLSTPTMILSIICVVILTFFSIEFVGI